MVLLLSERNISPSVTINMPIKAGQVAEPSSYIKRLSNLGYEEFNRYFTI